MSKNKSGEVDHLSNPQDNVDNTSKNSSEKQSLSGKKRNVEDPSKENQQIKKPKLEVKLEALHEDLKSVKAFLLDIEGTTTSISFVAETLFPYVRRNLSTYLKEHWKEKELQEDIQKLRELSEEDQKKEVKGVVKILGNDASEENIIKSIIDNVIWQMDQDRKSTALKQLQGHMWRIGYEKGELKGHVYEDTLDLFRAAQNLKIPVYIYSSGSIEAQKLIFGYSIKGDLLTYIKGHFDTASGSKLEASSYETIFQALKKQEGEHLQKIEEVLFITDNILEAEAASKVAMKVYLTNRPGNKPLPESHPFKVITSFHQLFEAN